MPSTIVRNRDYPLVANCPTVTEICEIYRFKIFSCIDRLFFPTDTAVSRMENPPLMPDNPAVFGIRKVDVCKMGFPVRLTRNFLFYTTR